jgi:UDPglucose--hexose-1-phosphate uridylyltransferase
MRKDYYRDMWAIITPARKRRPKETKSEPTAEQLIDNCPFCPGNERITPPEVFRVPNGSSWQIRVFPNKFSIPSEAPLTHEKPWKNVSLQGFHEVVVETPHHFQKTADLSIKELKILLQVFAGRIDWLENKDKIEYAEVFKNQGGLAGASITHTHFQIIATSEIAPRVQEKIDHSYQKDCAYCHIADVESESKRKVFENNHFVAFTAYAPQNNFEMWIVSKKHLRSFRDMDDLDLLALAEILKNALSAVDTVTDNYNMVINSGPKGKDFHFHIEIFPQFEHAIKAGFEIGTGISVISTSPEEAAKIYLSGTETDKNNRGEL